ncbi:MAG: ComEC/Rec2 family competence protein [Proteobacteria bacterium]|nr:ComEC/Rec2 family competence protein [Pseudomonadota bacterium]
MVYSFPGAWSPLRAFTDERERWVLWLPVLFGIGISIYFGLPVEPPLWLGALAVAVTALAGFAVNRFKLNRDGGPIAMLTLVAVIAAGFGVAQWRTAAVNAPMLIDRIGPTDVTGRATKVETFPNRSRVTLDRVRIAGLRPDRVPEKVRLSLRGEQPDITAGSWLRVRAMISPPPPPSAPGAFDFQRQSFFRQLGGVGFSIGRADILSPADDQGFDAIISGPARLRQTITTRIQTVLEGATGAVAAALMTGERSAIPEKVMQAIRDSGIAHLLAISGLHIGLVAGIIFIGARGLMALIPSLALRFPIKKWAALAAIAGAFAYALISGATVPTQRAFLMVGMVFVAVLLDRRGLSIRLVAWAALAILVVSPESLLGPSFQMSFAAVTALIATYEALSERRRYQDYDHSRLPPWARKAMYYLAGVALTTLIAGAATAPFAIFHFNRFTDYGLAANLVAVPVTALWVMPWAVVAFLLMPFGVEALALTPMGWGVDVIIGVADTVAGWSGAVTLLPAMPTAALAAVAGGGLWMALWRRRWRYWGLAGIAAGVLLAISASPPDVLVDGQGRLLAVRAEDGSVAVSSLRRARFDRNVWLRRFGLEEAGAIWPKTGTSPDQRLSCDLEGCLYRQSGRVVALAFAEAALAEDCWLADVVISVVPVRRACPAEAGVIDRFDLWRDGGAAIWLGEKTIRIETVNGARGKRPWVPVRGKKRETQPKIPQPKT